MDDQTKQQIQLVFKKLETILDDYKDKNEEEDSAEVLAYAEWMLTKAELRYIHKNKEHTFPLIYKRIYWAYMGLNVGREEDKHRPVVIVKVEFKSPICYVVPLTSQKLGDDYWYHIDLDGYENTALVEHFRTISKDRIDKPMYKGGQIAQVSTENMKEIHKEIRRMFASPPRER